MAGDVLITTKKVIIIGIIVIVLLNCVTIWQVHKRSACTCELDECVGGETSIQIESRLVPVLNRKQISENISDLPLKVIDTKKFSKILAQNHSTILQDTLKKKPFSDNGITTNSENITTVLIAATYRSGSSFVGKLLDRHPDSFYWFEPLMGLFVKYFDKKQIRKHPVFNGYSYEGREDDEHSIYLHKKAIETILDIYSCNMAKLHPDVLNQAYTLKVWASFKFKTAFEECHLKHKLKRSEENLEQCLPDMSHVCSDSPIRGVKTIRMSLSLVRSLMEQKPGLKVIHWIRDPRGIIQSRLDAVNNGQISTVKDVNVTCEQMRQDIQIFKEIKQVYPDRIILLKFEDLALNPMKYASKLYKYVGMSFPQSMKDWLQEHTTAKEQDGPMGVRRNSTMIAHRWKDKLDTFSKLVLLDSCLDVLKHYGYES